MSETADSVLLIGFGGPTKPDEIRPFLSSVVRGRNVPPERLEVVAHHYEAIGGSSPYNELTFRQAASLQDRLSEDGMPVPVYVGMRNWPPLLAETLREMAAAGRRRAVGVILAAHRSPTSWERYQRDVEEAQEATGETAPAFTYLPPWHAHPLFAAAQAARIEEATGYSPVAWPAAVPLLFTAHSIPVRMAEGCRYREEVEESAAAVAGQLGAPRWSVAWQSASGDGRVPWLGPDVNDVIRQLAAQGVREVVLAPVGFLCDHVEVLYDLDVEARQTVDDCDLRLARCGTVGDHPLFIRMLAQLVRGAAASGETRRES
jgi:ferrochelatase